MRIMANGRARLLGAAVGTCLVTALGVSNALAQDATPESSAEATPSAQTDQSETPKRGTSAVERTALAEQVQDVTDVIALVQADRDAVAGTLDVAAVDDLLAKATAQRDAAKAALDGDDVSSAPRQLAAARAAAMAAEALLRAQLSDYGLPSQQAGASRTLVAAYNSIHEIGERVAAGTDADSAAFLATAQSLYQAAYDLYNAGTFAQAADTAEVATQVGMIADMLAADVAHSEDGKVSISGGPANTDVVFVEPNAGLRPGHGPKDDTGRGHHGLEPAIEVVPFAPDREKGGLAGFVVVESYGPAGMIKIEAGLDDFSDESPLEVPAPDFD